MARGGFTRKTKSRVESLLAWIVAVVFVLGLLVLVGAGLLYLAQHGVI